MELNIKIYLADDEGEKFMGIGVLWLLEEIGKEGSLKKASEKLSLSYSKSYHMIKNAEEKLGMILLDRKKGGIERTGASLTPFALKFISLYRDFQGKVKELAKEPYEAFSMDLAALKEEFSDGKTV